MDTLTELSERYQWKQDLRRAMEEFLSADDAIRRANEGLKPLRLQKKIAKDRLQEIMTQQRVPNVTDPDRGEQLVLVQNSTKKKPNDTLLRQRCDELCKNAEKGGKLFKFLTAKVKTPSVSLRRKKAPVQQSDPVDEDVGYEPLGLLM